MAYVQGDHHIGLLVARGRVGVILAGRQDAELLAVRGCRLNFVACSWADSRQVEGAFHLRLSMKVEHIHAG